IDRSRTCRLRTNVFRRSSRNALSRSEPRSCYPLASLSADRNSHLAQVDFFWNIEFEFRAGLSSSSAPSPTVAGTIFGRDSPHRFVEYPLKQDHLISGQRDLHSLRSHHFPRVEPGGKPQHAEVPPFPRRLSIR